MGRWVGMALCLALTAACSGAPIASLAVGQELVVRSGTSFGFCLGYCVRELRVTADWAQLTETARDPVRNPPRVRSLPISAQEWSRISALADPARFQGLQEVYGCPDCADGGAEWVEVEQGGERRRVTFEHGRSVPGIQPLVEELRRIRERFPVTQPS